MILACGFPYKTTKNMLLLPLPRGNVATAGQGSGRSLDPCRPTQPAPENQSAESKPGKMFTFVENSESCRTLLGSFR